MALNKLIAIYLKLVATAVVVNFFVYPFYGPGDNGAEDNLDVWLVLDWFMAAALVLLLLTTWQRRSANVHDAGARRMFIAAVALTIAFVPNWFDAMVNDGGNFTIWHIIDTALPVLAWTEGHRLWKRA